MTPIADWEVLVKQSFLSSLLVVLLCTIALGQSTTDPAITSAPTDQSAVTNAPAPPPTPANERQAFRQNVGDVYFDFNRYDFTAEDHNALQKDAEWLKAHSEVLFTIEGDADERGSIVYNLFLSQERADATKDALEKLGVSSQQILFATGWGKLYPLCTQADESCWAQNRRAHLAPWPPGEVPVSSVQASAGAPTEAAAGR
jgi:peptidoglycan-associated lipoprotein